MNSIQSANTLSQEGREQLQGFLQRLNQARDFAVVPEADAMIRIAIKEQPNASYLLVQRAMLLDAALKQANEQIARLQKEVSAARAANTGGFLGQRDPWSSAYDGRSAAIRNVPSGPAPNTGAPSPWAGVLGNVATTAAGVVAGSFLFQGIEHLMGHHASSDGMTSNPIDPLAENTTINNYFLEPEGSAWTQKAPDDFQADAGDDFVDGGDDDSTWA